jgi:CSLREA domain-containing protein
VLAVAGLLPVFGAAPAGATVIVVNTTADSTATDLHCSLREAIMSANTNMPVDNCFVGSVAPLDYGARLARGRTASPSRASSARAS